MDYKTEKIRYISHELKNQLSICDLYTEILKKYCEKNSITDETILNSVENIKRSLMMSGNTLMELKSSECQELKKYSLNNVLEEAYSLAKVYGLSKGVNVGLSKNTQDATVIIDKLRFQGVVVNIIKNACEAFRDEKDKTINIQTHFEKDFAHIIISNNAEPIEHPEKIFNEGETTKITGSGLGLYIAKNNMEEMFGNLRLLKSDKTSTEFEISVKTEN